MQKYFRFIGVVILVITACIIGSSAVHAEENWLISDFSSEITVQPSGQVAISENITVDFKNEQKHGIFRDLPYIYSDDQNEKTATVIKIESVRQDDNAIIYDTNQNNANIRIKIGDPNRVISGKHTYQINYIATGILRSFGTYDELYWNVTGNEWPVPIATSSATIHLPESGVIQFRCYTGYLGENKSCLTQKIDDRTVKFINQNELLINQGLSVALGFTPGIVPITSVAMPKTFFEQVISPWTLLVFVVTLIGGGTTLFLRWWEHGRDQWYGHTANAKEYTTAIPFGIKESIAPEFTPPAKLRPAELGTLVDEYADTLDVTATIVDLAVRKYLTITEIPKKWLFGNSDYSLKRIHAKDADLLNFESKLLSAIFSSGEEVKLSNLKNTFYDKLRGVELELYKEVVKKNLFAKNPDDVRNTYVLAGLGITILAIIVIIVSYIWRLAPTVFWGFGLAFGLLGIATMISARAMPARTAHGRLLYRQTLGYKLFIETAEKYRSQFAEKENLFNELLPYAIVFGATKKLAHAMKVLAIQPAAPSWYAGIHPFNPTVFASDIDGFSKSLSSAIASTPSSSGSGGGGFSGGGFGGGGGGSW